MPCLAVPSLTIENMDDNGDCEDEIDLRCTPAASTPLVRFTLDGITLGDYTAASCSLGTIDISGLTVGRHELQVHAVSSIYGAGDKSEPIVFYYFDLSAMPACAALSYDDATSTLSDSQGQSILVDLFQIVDGTEVLMAEEVTLPYTMGLRIGTYQVVARPVQVAAEGHKRRGDASAAKTVDVSSVTDACGVTYTLQSDDTIKVTAYSADATATSLMLYSKVDGYSVTAIAAEVFMGHTELKSIQVPDTVKKIGARCFKGCTKLSIMTATTPGLDFYDD